MKARRKGSNDAFVEITEVSLANNPFGLYKISQIEFEQQQEPTSDHWQDVRERAAIAAIQAFCAAPVNKDTESMTIDDATKFAVEIADALVKKLQGE
jgi:hypothetical protein